MSILVNPITEKLAGKFAKTTLGKFVQQGKRLYKSIFGTPEAIKKQLAHNPYKPKTSIFEGNNPSGETVEQLLEKLSKKHGYQAVNVHGMKVYAPKASTTTPKPVKTYNPITGKTDILGSLTHEPLVHSTFNTGRKLHKRPAKPTRLTPEYGVKAKSFYFPRIQETRTQAYYDRLGAEIETAKAVKGQASFYNPRTGNTTTLYGNSNVTVSKGKVDLVELDNAPQGFRRITRTASDGKDYLHRGNSVTDYWDTSKGWRSETKYTEAAKIPYTTESPAVRTPYEDMGFKSSETLPNGITLHYPSSLKEMEEIIAKDAI